MTYPSQHCNTWLSLEFIWEYFIIIYSIFCNVIYRFWCFVAPQTVLYEITSHHDIFDVTHDVTVKRHRGRDVNQATTPRGRGHNPRAEATTHEAEATTHEAEDTTHEAEDTTHEADRGRGQDPSRDSSYYYI